MRVDAQTGERTVPTPPFSFSADYATWFDLSPDGRTLFMASRSLKARDLASSREITLLDDSKGVFRVSVSPDGQRLVATQFAAGARLLVLPATGGEAREIARIDKYAACCFVPPVWSADGRYVVFANPGGIDGTVPAALWRVAADGGTPEPLGLTVQSLTSLHISPDGRSLTAVSDQGAWLAATVEYDGDGNLAGLSGTRIGSLHGLDGKPVPGRTWADAEGLAQVPDGSWLVSFERNHRLWRYVTLDDKAVAVEGPAEITRQPSNAGIKSLTVTAAGQIVALSQGLSQQADTVVGWVGAPADGGRYRWQKFSYAVSGDFRPVDLAAVPDGSFIVLEYAFDATHGARSRLVLVAADQVRPDAVVRGTELAVIARPYNVEKYEAISVTRGRRGEILIWLMSDDDINPLQRNLLLQLELLPA